MSMNSLSWVSTLSHEYKFYSLKFSVVADGERFLNQVYLVVRQAVCHYRLWMRDLISVQSIISWGFPPVFVSVHHRRRRRRVKIWIKIREWESGEGYSHHISLLWTTFKIRSLHKQTHAMVLLPRDKYEKTNSVQVNKIKYKTEVLQALFMPLLTDIKITFILGFR